MVQVQSTWFPLIDRNPQKFVDIYSATESDFQKATQRVYRSAEMPSHLEVLEVVRRESGSPGRAARPMARLRTLSHL